MTLEEEAEETYREYPNDPIGADFNYNKDIHCYKKRKAFIKGANSKYVQREKLKAQIELLKNIISNCVLRDTASEVRNYLYELQQQLKELEDEY